MDHRLAWLHSWLKEVKKYKKEHDCSINRQNELFVVTRFHVALYLSKKIYVSAEMFIYEFYLLSDELIGTVL